MVESMVKAMSYKQAKRWVDGLPYKQFEVAELIGVSPQTLNGVLTGIKKSDPVLLKLTLMKTRRDSGK